MAGIRHAWLALLVCACAAPLCAQISAAPQSQNGLGKAAAEALPSGAAQRNLTPPVLLERVGAPPTEEARRDHVQGTVWLSLVVEPDGSTSHVRVLRGLGHGLDEASVAAASQWRFAPALDGEKPIAVHVQETVKFEIKDNPPRP